MIRLSGDHHVYKWTKCAASSLYPGIGICVRTTQSGDQQHQHRDENLGEDEMKSEKVLERFRLQHASLRYCSYFSCSVFFCIF